MEFTFYVHEKVTVWRSCKHVIDAANKTHAVSKMKDLFKEDDTTFLESSEYLLETTSFPIERELFDDNDKLLKKEICSN